MKASEARKARLPSLLTRVFARSPEEGVQTSITPLAVQATLRSRRQASEMHARCSSPLQAEHGKACFPRLFKLRIRRFCSSKFNGFAIDAGSSGTHTIASKRAMNRLHPPFSPLSRKPGSTTSSFYISSPICTAAVKDTEPQIVDIHSLRAKQMPGIAPLSSEPVEPSNASSELLHASSDCLVAETNRLMNGFPKEVVLTPKRHLRKVPPAFSADDWHLVGALGPGQQSELEVETNTVPMTSMRSDLRDALKNSSLDILGSVLNQEEERSPENNVVEVSHGPKVLAFGTNPILPEDIVQAFIKTRMFPRRVVRPSRTKVPATVIHERPALLCSENTRGAANEGHTSEVQIVTSESFSPLSSASDYRSDDTPTYGTTPALSSADSASIYSCSSAAYSTNDDVTVAASTPNESDLDSKCFETIIHEAKDQMAALEASLPSPRHLVTRSFPSGLSISIPLKAHPLRNVISDNTIHEECMPSPEVTENLNGHSRQLTLSDDPLVHQGDHDRTPPVLEDVSFSKIETINKPGRSRRHGAVYGKQEPVVPFLPRSDDMPNHPASKPDVSSCTPTVHGSVTPYASISYRADSKPGLRPLLLPRLLPQYHDERNSRITPGTRSISPSTPNEDTTSTSPTTSSPQSPFYDISGISENEWSFISTPPTSETGSNGLPLLRPEHIKLRRSKSSLRLLVTPGPAF